MDAGVGILKVDCLEESLVSSDLLPRSFRLDELLSFSTWSCRLDNVLLFSSEPPSFSSSSSLMGSTGKNCLLSPFPNVSKNSSSSSSSSSFSLACSSGVMGPSPSSIEALGTGGSNGSPYALTFLAISLVLATTSFSFSSSSSPSSLEAFLDELDSIISIRYFMAATKSCTSFSVNLYLYRPVRPGLNTSPPCSDPEDPALSSALPKLSTSLPMLQPNRRGSTPAVQPRGCTFTSFFSSSSLLTRYSSRSSLLTPTTSIRKWATSKNSSSTYFRTSSCSSHWWMRSWVPKVTYLGVAAVDADAPAAPPSASSSASVVSSDSLLATSPEA
mmetsp:Transcript_32950/g.70191  ORF Transcript_32950/g.70191 Transcript_32950/m.70191 type:complete len:329 (+) Transcript_32950:1198-2184(+)